MTYTESFEGNPSVKCKIGNRKFDRKNDRQSGYVYFNYLLLISLSTYSIKLSSDETVSLSFFSSSSPANTFLIISGVRRGNFAGDAGLKMGRNF